MNIAEILKDKPKGTKLYDYLYNKEVKFDNIISVNGETSIWCVRTNENNVVVHHGYSELGTLRGCEDGLQILMPSKDMRDWYKFAWKKGAILVSNDGGTVVMFFDWANDAYTEFLGAKFPVKKEEGKSTFNTCDFESCCQDYNIELWVNPTTGEFSVKTVRITVGNSEPNEPNMPIEPKYSFKPFDKDLGKAIQKSIDENSGLIKQVEQFQAQVVQQMCNRLVNDAKDINGVKVIKAIVPFEANSAKDLVFKIRERIPEHLVCAIGSNAHDKPMLSVMFSDDMVSEHDLNAGKIVREAAKLIKGGGGGQPHYAQAGGKDLDGLNAAVDKLVELCKL